MRGLEVQVYNYSLELKGRSIKPIYLQCCHAVGASCLACDHSVVAGSFTLCKSKKMKMANYPSSVSSLAPSGLLSGSIRKFLA